MVDHQTPLIPVMLQVMILFTTSWTMSMIVACGNSLKDNLLVLKMNGTPTELANKLFY